MKDYDLEIQTNTVKQVIEFLTETNQDFSDATFKIIRKCHDDLTYPINIYENFVLSKLLVKRVSQNGFQYFRIIRILEGVQFRDYIVTNPMKLDKVKKKSILFYFI